MDLTAKADTDLQNIDTDLDATEQGNVRTRIGAIASSDVDLTAKADTDLQNIDTDLDATEQAAVRTNIGAAARLSAWNTGVVYAPGVIVRRSISISTRQAVYVCLRDHTSTLVLGPGGADSASYWALLRTGDDLVHATGYRYTPGLVVRAATDSSAVFICRWATDEEPSEFSSAWFFMPRGSVVIVAPSGEAHTYRSPQIVIVDEDMYFCHTSVFGAGITTADIPSSSSFTLLSSHLVTRQNIQDKDSEIAGLVDGKLAYESITAHRSFVHSIPEVARIPSSFIGPTIVLTRDHEQGAQANIQVTPAFTTDYAGYSDGSGFAAQGAVASSTKEIVAIWGTGTSAGYSIQYIASRNEDLIDSLDEVEIIGNTYSLGVLDHLYGWSIKEINSFPTGVNAIAYAFNARFEDDNSWYLNDAATSTDPAGLYNWDRTSSAYLVSTSPVALTDAQAVDDADTTNFGTVSGDQLEKAVAAHAPTPTTLTDAQAVDDADETNFGAVSGDQLEKAVAAHAPTPTTLTDAQAVDDADETNFGAVSGDQLEKAVVAHAPDPDALTEAELRDKDSTTTGLAQGSTLYNALTAHKSFLGSLPQVAFLPSSDIGNLINLPYDHSVGVRGDITVTVGFSGTDAGYSAGNEYPAFGSATGLGPIERLLGTGTAASYSLTTVASQLEHFMDNAVGVWVAGTFYSLGSKQVGQGVYYREINSPPTALSAATVTFNIQIADDPYYNNGATSEDAASIYHWDTTTTSYLYGIPDDPNAPQEAPPENPALTSYRADFHRLRLWQQAATAPTAPTAGGWWNNTTGLDNAGFGSWHQTRVSAVDANPGDNTNPVWFALDSVSVSAGGGQAYNGWEVFQEFGVEYSSDGTNWHATQADDDIYFGFRAPDGSRRVVEIALPLDDEWTLLWNQAPYTTNGSGRSYTWTEDFALYERFRFRMQPFGDFSSGQAANRGAEFHTILYKHRNGTWRTAANNDDTDENGTHTIYYDEITGLSIARQEAGSLADGLTFPNTILTSGSLSGVSLPFRRYSLKFKWLTTDTNNPGVPTHIRFFDHPGNYQRFYLTIYGSTR